MHLHDVYGSNTFEEKDRKKSSGKSPMYGIHMCLYVAVTSSLLHIFLGSSRVKPQMESLKIHTHYFTVSEIIF